MVSRLLTHIREGNGQPLLLMHGFGMSHEALAPVAARLRDAYECFAVDLPGFGASAPLQGPPTMRALADACAAFMRARGHERFHAAGNSMGGGVALHLALDGRALSACGLSPLGFGQGWERAYLQLSLVLARLASPLGARLARRFGGSDRLLRALAAQYALHAERIGGDRLARAFDDLLGGPGYCPTLRHAINWVAPAVPGTLPCPVTIAWGEKDRLLLTRPQSARARERLPAARHLTLRGCGHLPTWDDPDQSARVVREAAEALVV